MRGICTQQAKNSRMSESQKKRIYALEDQVRESERRIAELKAELEEERDRVTRQNEHVKDVNDMIEEWKQAFEMIQNDEGYWTFDNWVTEMIEWRQKYWDLLDKWNKFVVIYNARVAPRNIGRPIAASESQRETVVKLSGKGYSLRGIADETGLTLATVRTIISQRSGTDRTTLKHLERIDPERARRKTLEAKSRMIRTLPKKIAALEKAGGELLKELKGLA